MTRSIYKSTRLALLLLATLCITSCTSQPPHDTFTNRPYYYLAPDGTAYVELFITDKEEPGKWNMYVHDS